MQEVEAICDRVLIIDRGKLVMDSPISEMGRNKEETVSMRIVLKEEIGEVGLSELPGLIECRKVRDGEWLIKGRETAGEDFRQVLFQFCTAKGYVVLEMNQLTTSMEQVFQELTGSS
jgi:ABC-2 type transport system ATP-binding protein